MNTNARARRRGSYIPTAKNLENQALFYLSRYAASEASLRRTLENKLRRVAMQNPSFANDAALQNQLRAAIDAIIEKHKGTGTLNDAAYAEMKASGLRRAGRSARAIRMKLGQKGIAKSTIERALDYTAEGDTEEAEFKAAVALAKRRRLGAFRLKPSADPNQSRKDLATLARAGFSLDVARKALEVGG